MDIEKLFGKNLPPAVTELLALLLSETGKGISSKI